ncbi:MAG: PilX N-terminal domain-containing pilus assembly protein [Thermoanaerobaculaceae bacterium]|jgi:type II secretory pathway pseudopilin PulG
MRQEERGVALVMVILVLLILTVLGITAVMMMTQEDKTSSRQELQKAALYASEAGLRRAELILAPFQGAYSSNTLTMFFSHIPVARTAAAPPSAGSDPQVPVPPPSTMPPLWDLQHLGTYLTTVPGGGEEVANQEITQVATGGNPIRVYYSVYVRNNVDDLAPGGALSPLVNYDPKLRLISVGFVTDSQGVDQASGNARVLGVKIIEEELNLAGAPNNGDYQKCKDAGCTSSGFWSGRITG